MFTTTTRTLRRSLVAAAAGAILALSLLAAPLARPADQGGSASAQAAATDACGPVLARPGGGTWACVGVDNFSGNWLDTRLWTALDQPGHRGGACYRNTNKTVTVAQGSLRLTIRPVTKTLTCPAHPDGTSNSFASGSLTTAYKWSQQYGRFEARIHTQATRYPGLQEAFWLWPDARYTDTSTWPASGEIDIAETYSEHYNLVVPFLHYGAHDNGGPVPGLNTAWDCPSTRGAWHTYAVEWTADAVDIYVDGELCLHNTAGAPSFRKLFTMNLTQLLGSGTNAYDGRAPMPATMRVDYVKVWK